MSVDHGTIILNIIFIINYFVRTHLHVSLERVTLAGDSEGDVRGVRRRRGDING